MLIPYKWTKLFNFIWSYYIVYQLRTMQLFTLELLKSMSFIWLVLSIYTGNNLTYNTAHKYFISYSLEHKHVK